MEQLQELAKMIDPLFNHLFKYLLRGDANKIEKGLGRVHLEVLHVLLTGEKDGESIPSSLIAERLLISRAYTTALVDKLVGMNLASRIPDSRDRRYVWIKITPKGIAPSWKRAPGRTGRSMRKDCPFYHRRIGIVSIGG